MLDTALPNASSPPLRGDAMDAAELQTIIDRAWESRATISLDTKGGVRAAVMHSLALLDAGKLRGAEKIDDEAGPASWRVHQWLKKAVLLSFRLNDMTTIPGGPGGTTW